MSLDLNRPAEQSQLALLVGVSQQAISRHLADGHLTAGATLGQWLLEYCEHQRAIASGRAGEDQVALTRARTRSENIKADRDELAYQRDIGNLAPVAEFDALIRDWALAGRAALSSGLDQLIAAIERAHSIQVDPKTKADALHAIARIIADYPQHADRDRAPGSGELDTAA